MSHELISPGESPSTQQKSEVSQQQKPAFISKASEARVLAHSSLQKISTLLDGDFTHDGLIDGVIQECGVIKNRYKQILQEILEDGRVISEMRRSYIQNVMGAKVKGLKIDELSGVSGVFCQTLEDYLDQRDPEQKQKGEEALDTLFTENIRLGLFDNYTNYQSLLNGTTDEKLNQQLAAIVAKQAAADIIPIKSKVEPHFSSSESFWILIHDWVIYPSAIRSNENYIVEGSFERKLDTFFLDLDSTSRGFSSHILDSKDPPDMNIWQALRSSPTANEAFGDAIKNQDREYYENILNKSLEGGAEFITDLQYYPTPDAIKFLVLSSTIDYGIFFSIAHVSQNVLGILAKRPYWHNILDEAEKVYPDLKDARGVLQSWYYDDYTGSHSEIQDSVQKLALKIYEDGSGDQRFKTFATDALNNSSILSILTKRGVMPEEIVKDLNEAEDFLEQISASDSTFKKEVSDFSEGIREHLLEILGSESGVTDKEKVDAITKFHHFSKNILANKDLSSADFLLAIRFPELFLQGDEGVALLREYSNQGVFSLEKSIDIYAGKAFKSLEDQKKDSFVDHFVRDFFNQTEGVLSSEQSPQISRKNWQVLLITYCVSRNLNFNLSEASIEKINTMFNDPKTKDFCLNEMKNQWNSYLQSGKPGEIPFSVTAIPEFLNQFRGAETLSQIKSLGLFIGAVNNAFYQDTTAQKTKIEIFTGLKALETRFAKEKWSDEDRSSFYNISRDILNAAPSLFSDYLTVFDQLTPSQMKIFAKEIYPLYKVKLVLLEKTNEDEEKGYERSQLVEFRKAIRNFTSILNKEENPFELQKQKLLNEIQSIFKDRFGIIKFPKESDDEHMRSLTNVTSYLSNLNGRNPDTENVLGLYLSLMINDRWDDFRRGMEVNPTDYLTSDKAVFIKKLIDERQELSPLTPENLGISEKDIPEFMRLLQDETQNMTVGNIETIDVKLNTIILNLSGLEDLDIYPDPLDKHRMKLLLEFGNKRVGAIVAKLYQQQEGRKVQFSEEDNQIREQIFQMIKENKMEVNSKNLKEYFQDGIKPFATVVNLLSFVKDSKTDAEIQALRQFLIPTQGVVDIFSRLGEEFKPTSGAMALSQDLTYLDNLIVKREDELKPDEKVLLTTYITKIRSQMVKLQVIYDQIRNKFIGLKQGASDSKNPLLKVKLSEIDKIINTSNTQQAITSTVTNNLNTVIENIRECLSCSKEGSNNDTNLTFGDMNKFYIYSQAETQPKGSISDQLVFLEPITRNDGSGTMAFVLDRIYGVSTPTVLENQVEAVLKKYRGIRQRFPNIKLNIFVSDAAIVTGGTSKEMFMETLKAKNITCQTETVDVNVIESAFSDHYVEFGGETRKFGKRQISGILL